MCIGDVVNLNLKFVFVLNSQKIMPLSIAVPFECLMASLFFPPRTSLAKSRLHVVSIIIVYKAAMHVKIIHT